MQDKITFQDVINKLIKRIGENLKVASCGVVKSINDNTYSVSLFPVTTEENAIVVDAYCLNNLDVKVGDSVLILFTDRPNKNSINEVRNDVTNLSKLKDEASLHEYKNGIIIGTLKS